MKAKPPPSDLTYLEWKIHRWLLAHKNGGTWDEIAAGTKLPTASVSPRFAPMRRKGLICAKYIDGIKIKRPGSNGINQTVWFAK